MILITIFVLLTPKFFLRPYLFSDIQVYISGQQLDHISNILGIMDVKLTLYSRLYMLPILSLLHTNTQTQCYLLSFLGSS